MQKKLSELRTTGWSVWKNGDEISMILAQVTFCVLFKQIPQTWEGAGFWQANVRVVMNCKMWFYTNETLSCNLLLLLCFRTNQMLHFSACHSFAGVSTWGNFQKLHNVHQIYILQLNWTVPKQNTKCGLKPKYCVSAMAVLLGWVWAHTD